MKKKVISILSFLIIVLLVSCGSTPEETPVEIPETPVETTEEKIIEEEPETSVLITKEESRRKEVTQEKKEAVQEKKEEVQEVKKEPVIEEPKKEPVTDKPEKEPVKPNITPIIEEPKKEEIKKTEPEKELVSQEEVNKLLSDINDIRNSALKAGAKEKVPKSLKEADEYFYSLKKDNLSLKNNSGNIIKKYNKIIEEIKQIDAENAALLKAQSSIETARQNALNANSDKNLPEEFKELDNRFSSLKSDKEKLKTEWGKLAEDYNKLADLSKEIQLGNKILVSIESAKEKALKAGADKLFTKEIKELNKKFNLLKSDNELLRTEGPDLIESYEKLADLSMEINAEKKLLSLIEETRAKVVNLGVDKKFPNELKQVDDYCEKLKKDRIEFLKEGPNVPYYYELLIDLMKGANAEQRLLATIKLARRKAIRAGAETLIPDKLKQLDDYVEKIKTDNEKWKSEGAKLPGYYDTLVRIINEMNAVNNIYENIKVSREKAVTAGAETRAKEELEKIDNYFNLIKDSRQQIKASGHKVSNAYKSLIAYMGARETKQIIDEEDLSSYAQDNYDNGSKKFNTVTEYYNNMETVPNTIIMDATEARRDFNTVVTNAYRHIAKTERSLAYAEKRNSDLVRAAVTKKDRYDNAVNNFQKGDDLYSMQYTKKSIEYYKSAKEEFSMLHSDVSEDMLEALAAIEDAKKYVEESSLYAEEADKKVPITGDNIEGIEDEDTVLLEADDYANPEDYVINLSKVVEIKEGSVPPEKEDDIEILKADEAYVEQEVKATTEEEIDKDEDNPDNNSEKVIEETSKNKNNVESSVNNGKIVDRKTTVTIDKIMTADGTVLEIEVSEK